MAISPRPPKGPGASENFQASVNTYFRKTRTTECRSNTKHHEQVHEEKAEVELATKELLIPEGGEDRDEEDNDDEVLGRICRHEQ